MSEDLCPACGHPGETPLPALNDAGARDGAPLPGGRRSMRDFARRLETAQALVGYTQADSERVWASRDLLLPHADAIASAVYEHLLSHPETAVHFTDPDGRPDRAHLDARARSLKEWLVATIEAPLDERFAAYLAGIGRAHTRRGGNPAIGVKGRYLLMTISFAQTALLSLLDAAIPDRAEFVATVGAWNKLLMIQLDMFLAVYGGAEGNPHWY
jgi:hypothetical protein